MLLLVKKINDMEIRAAEEYIKCESYYALNVGAKIDFIVESGREMISFSGSYRKSWTWGHSGHGITTGRFTWRPPVIQVDFPPYLLFFGRRPQDDVLVDLLLFENKIIDGQMMVFPRCNPDLDTTYNLNFRAKITGLCEPDFLNNSGREGR
jgi:hypothetical protein